MIERCTRSPQKFPNIIQWLFQTFFIGLTSKRRTQSRFRQYLLFYMYASTFSPFSDKRGPKYTAVSSYCNMWRGPNIPTTVKTCLASHGEHDTIWPFLCNHLLNKFRCYWQEVHSIGLQCNNVSTKTNWKLTSQNVRYLQNLPLNNYVKSKIPDTACGFFLIKTYQFLHEYS